MNAPNRQSGFTLLEVMAAFVVFALLFATTLQIMSASMRNIGRSEEFSQAALWAQSRMDAVGIDPPIEEGQWRGDFNDEYSWELDIVPYDSSESVGASFDEIPVVLYYVELRVLWGEDQPRQAVFKTLRSAAPERS
ncbi:MAG: type II secretion system protein [Xanthomonadales bacterium]|nr:type II secretion system protein [Xanthomonadales bacterium]